MQNPSVLNAVMSAVIYVIEGRPVDLFSGEMPNSERLQGASRGGID